MNVVLIAAAICLAIVGIVGAIVPGIAGPPFSYLSVLAVSFVEGVEHSVTFLVVMGVIAAVIFTLDYIVPVWGTKKFGGSKAGMWGSTIGRSPYSSMRPSPSSWRAHFSVLISVKESRKHLINKPGKRLLVPLSVFWWARC